jgi:hypothetical protein
MSTSPVVIGFATSCMNRKWQLEYTLRRNLEVLQGTRHFLAVVDYGSNDDLGLLLRTFSRDLERGTLVCFRTDEPRRFHMSIAKNTAHRLALRREPSVLFNLDADNFVTAETVRLVEETFADGADACLHNLSPALDDGSFGRVALRAESWRRLGGYDEQLLAASWGEVDLLYRCRALGLTYVQTERGLFAPIPNTIDEKVSELDLPATLTAPTSLDLYVKLRRQNMLISAGRGPIRLPFEEQRRFEGVINFQDLTVV